MTMAILPQALRRAALATSASSNNFVWPFELDLIPGRRDAQPKYRNRTFVADGFKALKIKVGDVLLAKGWSRADFRAELNKLIAAPLPAHRRTRSQPRGWVADPCQGRQPPKTLADGQP
jgi:hypothetical protein